MCACSDLRQLYEHPSTQDDVVDLVNSFVTLVYRVLERDPRTKKSLSYTIKRKRTQSENILARISAIRKSKFDTGVQKKLLCDFQNDPEAFWTAPKKIRTECDRPVSQHGDERTALRSPFYVTLSTCLHLELAQEHASLQLRILSVIVWFFTESIPGQIQAEAKAFHESGQFTHLPHTKLQERIARIRLRGKNLFNVLIKECGLGALIAYPTDIPITVWEYISLKSIDASETDDEDDRQDRTQVQEQVNLLRREVASEAHQYEEFVIKLIWVQIKDVISTYPKLQSFFPQERLNAIADSARLLEQPPPKRRQTEHGQRALQDSNYTFVVSHETLKELVQCSSGVDNILFTHSSSQELSFVTFQVPDAVATTCTEGIAHQEHCPVSISAPVSSQIFRLERGTFGRFLGLDGFGHAWLTRTNSLLSSFVTVPVQDPNLVTRLKEAGEAL